ncbi:MAG TPA: hypothetical protein VFF06_12175, partial [Polyangia bacterium]|nr:hypothetical protein [Polyangia bacterium]
ARHGVHGAYWLRVQCFADAARARAQVGADCRRVFGRGDIRRVVKRAIARGRGTMLAAAGASR